MSINLDFSSVPSREPLEEGVYHLQIAKVEETNSSTGNPMLKVEYDVLGVEGNRLDEFGTWHRVACRRRVVDCYRL